MSFIINFKGSELIWHRPCAGVFAPYLHPFCRLLASFLQSSCIPFAPTLTTYGLSAQYSLCSVAEIDIPGIPKHMAAHSQVSDAGKGLVGSGNGNFVAQSVPNNAGDLVYRGIDTEYKILDNIADQLGRNTSVRGTVNILTEKAACASCLNVAEQFKAKYPNITVNILDNQGVMLRPPRKTP